MLFIIFSILAVAFMKPSIILVISDGTGFQHVELGRLIEYGADGHESSYKTLDYLRPIMTYNSDSTLTDSAAAATAISSGVLTTNGKVGLDKDNKNVETFIEYLHRTHKDEYATGVVVKYYLTHATPGGFMCHSSSRNDSAPLADSLLNDGSAADVMMGAGDNEERKLGNPEYINKWAAKGYNVYTSDDYYNNEGKPLKKLSEQKAPFYAVFGKNSPEELDPNGSVKRGDRMGWYIERTDENNKYEPNLIEMTTEAVRMLKETDKPFFLMVEASMVDTAAHLNQKERLAGESIELEKLLRQIKEWIDNKTITDDLRLLVTADHETGATTIPDTLETLINDKNIPDKFKELEDGTIVERTIGELNEIRKRRVNELDVNFGWKEHSTTYVMLGGHGKNTEIVNNALHISDIRKIMEAFVDGTESSIGTYPTFVYEAPSDQGLAFMIGISIAIVLMLVILLSVFLGITKCCKRKLVILKTFNQTSKTNNNNNQSNVADITGDYENEIQIAADDKFKLV